MWSARLSVCLSVYLFFCLSVLLSVCLFFCLSVLLSVCPFFCLSVCLSVCSSVYLFGWNSYRNAYIRCMPKWKYPTLSFIRLEILYIYLKIIYVMVYIMHTHTYTNKKCTFLYFMRNRNENLVQYVSCHLSNTSIWFHAIIFRIDIARTKACLSMNN